MKYSGFAATLELAYAPMSSHDFAQLKKDPEIKQILQNSMVYALCQRPMLTFENLVLGADGRSLQFEIHQQGSAHVLSCFLPFNQLLLDADGQGLQVVLGYYDTAKDGVTPPPPGINGFHFQTAAGKPRLWLSPDKFLHLYWQKTLTATVTGDHRQFTHFLVHYVGKATDQPIINRLKSHSTLLEILSQERPMVEGTLPAHEVMLLLFQTKQAEEVSILYTDADRFIDATLLGLAPTAKTVALDTEKMLVSRLQPEYNHPDKRFQNYPDSTDGLHKHNYTQFCYRIKDDITLSYNQVSIVGSMDDTAADIVAVQDNSTVEIIQQQPQP